MAVLLLSLAFILLTVESDSISGWIFTIQSENPYLEHNSAGFSDSMIRPLRLYGWFYPVCLQIYVNRVLYQHLNRTH